MRHLKLLSITIFILLFIGFVTSCDTTGTDADPGQGNVTLQLETVSDNSSSKAGTRANISSEHDSLVVEGDNGTLQINDIRFIVEEFELEPADDDHANNAESEIEEFEAEPFFVDLPLSEDTMSLADSEIQAGLYEELDFEVENLDMDDNDEGDGHQSLASTIREEFPDWPDDASMVIIGTFTPSDGDPQSFKVFAEAEIEIEREFERPLEVTDNNSQHVVSIRINPVDWLQRSDGTVINLTEYDWDEHQELLEFEAEFEDGVKEIEIED